MQAAGLKPDQSFPPYEPHLLDKGFREEAVELHVVILGKDSIKYEFNLAFLEKKVIKEEMYFYPNGAQSVLY